MTVRDLQQLTEKIRQANDIVDVVGSFVSLKPAGKNLKGLCPFHKEKTPSFNVMPDRQFFKCFGCNAAGDVFSFIQQREGVDFLEAREILARRANISLDAPNPQPTRSGGTPTATKADLERVNQWAAKWFRQQILSDIGAACREYVMGRGLTEATAEQFELGFAPAGWDALKNAAAQKGIAESWLVEAGLLKQKEDGRTYDAFRNRLIFPIHDALSRVIGFGGRALDDDPAKYLNSPQSTLFDKSRCLYGVRQARDSWKTSRRAVLTEGYMDCIMCHQAGCTDAIATLGTALTAEHARMLTRYVDKATLLFDADDAGQAAADRAIPVVLPEKLEVDIANVPEGKDPADLIVNQGKEGIDKVLTSALPALTFKWRTTHRQYQSAGTDGDKRRAVEAYLAFIGQAINDRFADAIQRGFILNQVGKLLGLSVDQVERQLRIVTRRQPAGEVDERNQRAVGRLPKPTDATHAALRDVLAVLLNQPGVFPAVDEVFDPQRFGDALEKKIAEMVRADITSGRPFEMNALMSQLAETPGAAQRIADLVVLGETRGNFDATVEGALARLHAIERDRQLSNSLTTWKFADAESSESDRHTDDASSVIETESKPLETVQRVARESNHFAARRHLAAPSIAGAKRRGASPSENAKGDTRQP